MSMLLEKANASIEYDHKSFWIDGERVFLNSAAINYFRMPQQEWRDILVKAKLAGINCIDVYFAWNYHEPQEGQWDFDGDKDCELFLQLCKQLGLWVIARPGPFICAEWDFGGLPWWLTQKQNIKYREKNEPFLHYVDLYFDKIIPIISRNQITAGGPVILVQVENEYAHHASDEEGKEYLDYLRDGMQKRGINVPFISCVGGVEHAIETANFWSNAQNHYNHLVKKQPDTPKIVTEFWTGWFEHWGGASANHKTPALYEKKIMDVIRTGFTGLNHFMFFGGTNFGDWGGRTVGASDIFMVTSYDYNAPINEFGTLTPKYFSAKRLGYWVNALEQFITEACDTEADVVSSIPCTVRVKQWKEQKLLFVEHEQEERTTIHLALENEPDLQVTVEPGQIMPVLINYQLTPEIKMTYNSWVGGFEKIDDLDTLLIYAESGQRSVLRLEGDEQWTYDGGLPVLYTIENEGKTITFDFCHFHTPQVLEVCCGNRSLRIIVLDQPMMDRTWWLHENGNKQLVIGADSIVEQEDGTFALGFRSTRSKVKVFGQLSTVSNDQSWTLNAKEKCMEKTFLMTLQAPALPDLSNWQWAQEELSSTDDAVKYEEPVGFAEQGQGFGYLIYSTEIVSDSNRTTTVVLSELQDPVRVYVNGKETALIRNMFSAAVEIPLKQGKNVLQFFVQHMGRYNFSHFLGESKGINGKVYLDGHVEDIRQGWMSSDHEVIHLDKTCRVDKSAVLKKSVYLKDTFDHVLLTGVIGENLQVNGKRVNIGPYRYWYKYHCIDLSSYMKPGENIIEMNYFTSPVQTLNLIYCSSSKPLNDWSIQRLTSEKKREWLELNHLSDEPYPRWFRCAFQMPVLSPKVKTALKIRMTGMGKGTIWLNGYNLGRYWQIGPQEDYKIPLAWLEEHNELLLFDEEGRNPAQIELLWEDAIYLP